MRGNNGAAYYKSSPDGTTWSSWHQVNSAIFSFGPMPVVFNDRLWLFIRGNNGTAYSTSSADGLSWDGWTQVDPAHFSAGPVPVVFTRAIASNPKTQIKSNSYRIL